MKKTVLSRIISTVAVFTLCFSALSSTVSAMAATLSSSRQGAQKTSFNYVALGASNTAGYGLHGYNYDYIYEYPTEKSIGNRYGYKMHPEDSYPVLIRDELNKMYNTNLEVIAASSMRAEEVHVLLDDDYIGDKYTDNWFYDMNGDGVSYFWSYYPGVYEYQRFAEAGVPGYNADPSYTPTPKEAFDALRKATKESVANADLITVDAGMNNFGTYMFNLIASGWFSNDLGEISPELGVYYDAARDYAIDVIKKVVGDSIPETMLRNFADTLSYAAVGYCLNINSIMEHIFELNPDAEVVLISAQSMLHGLNIVMPGYDGVIPFGEIFDIIVDAANFYTAVLSPYADKYYFANVSEDGHVEFLKDEAANYNGDPSTIPLNMKDCFDVLDGSLILKTRVQQMFATQMSESGFVNITDVQKDATTIDGVKTFHNGFHYDRYDNTEFTPITLADGTYLKDFIKNGENGKLPDNQRAVYEIYERMLALAYDVAMEVFGEAAKQSLVDLTVTMNPALSGVKAADILLEVLGKAMEESLTDSSYSFSLNEMYPDGFFSTYEQENGLPEGTLCSKFSFALFLEFAESAFSHPNYEGHREVFNTTWTAYTQKLTGKDITDIQLGIHYMPTENSHYVAVSSGSAGYAELFADSIGLTKDQLGQTTWDNIDYSEIDKADLVSIDFSENEMLGFAVDQVLAYVENYVSTDVRAALTSYVSSVIDGIPYLSALGFRDIAKNKVNSTLDDVLDNELFAGKTMVELDWSKLLDEDMLPMVELVRSEIEKFVINSIGFANYTVSIDVVEWLSRNADSFDTNPVASKILKKTSLLYSLFGDKAIFSVDIPVADGIVYAMESYLYSYVEYMLKSNALISYINSNHPDTKIIIFGHFNPMKGTYLEVGDAMINVGELVEVVALTSSVRSFVQYSMSSNSAFVHIIDAESYYKVAVDAGEIDADLLTFFTLYLNDRSIVDVSPESNQYIVDQMLRYVTLDCDEHEYDSCDDTICNQCGDERTPISHVTGGCEDTVCDLCGNTVNAVGHSFGEWAVTKEPDVDTEGEERRVCSSCGYTETRKLPALENDNNDGAIVAITIACVAVAGAAGFCCYWFIIRKKIISTIVKSKSDD
ncbi:MAG: hypothetical protein IJX92_02560 [Clostridia bacterium]|nr:hypothetical protein [Clostridia bacterium]